MSRERAESLRYALPNSFSDEGSKRVEQLEESNECYRERIVCAHLVFVRTIFKSRFTLLNHFISKGVPHIVVELLSREMEAVVLNVFSDFLCEGRERCEPRTISYGKCRSSCHRSFIKTFQHETSDIPELVCKMFVTADDTAGIDIIGFMPVVRVVKLDKNVVVPTAFVADTS